MRSSQNVDADFTAWLTTNQPRLEDFASVVCGRRTHHRALLVDVLAQTVLAWDRLGGRDPETLWTVYRMIIGSHRCPWLRLRHRSGRSRRTPVSGRRGTRDRVADLPRRHREVVAARFCAGLDVIDTAALLHRDPAEVRRLERAVRGELGRLSATTNPDPQEVTHGRHPGPGRTPGAQAHRG